MVMHLATQAAEQNILTGKCNAAKSCMCKLWFRMWSEGGIGVPVHIRSSLLHHGLFSVQYLLRVEDVEEVDRHVEWHRHVLPHGVGHLIFWVDHCILTGEGEEKIFPL